MEKRDHWSSRAGLILAAAGSAVGLGNLWKFPYIAWENGGGLFILIYLVAIILVGFPIMITEVGIGKISERDPVGAFRLLGGHKSPFRWVGLMGIASAFLILSFYSIVAGWAIQYSFHSITGKFGEVPAAQVATLMESPKNVELVKTTALNEALSKDLSDHDKKEMLRDANLYPPPPVGTELSSYTNELWLPASGGIKESLEKTGKLDKWKSLFHQRYVDSKEYDQWLAHTLRPAHSTNIFLELVDDPVKKIFFHLIIMLITTLIVIGGIHSGIEKFAKIFMPVLFLLMGVLVVNSLMLDTEQQGVRYLVFGDISKLKAESIITALGHAFFTLSLGMGAMMTYGSYMKKTGNLLNASIWITAMDTIVAILACLMIYPIIFVYGLTPSSSSVGILFTTLPLEFFNFQGGAILSLFFYLLVLLAALTSAISLLEVVVTYFVDEKSWNRKKSVLVAAGLIFLFGVPSAFYESFFDFVDSLTSNFMLPVGGLLIALFAGYKMDIDRFQEELDAHGYPKWVFYFFKTSVRYITPFLVLVVFAVQIKAWLV